MKLPSRIRIGTTAVTRCGRGAIYIGRNRHGLYVDTHPYRFQFQEPLSQTMGSGMFSVTQQGQFRPLMASFLTLEHPYDIVELCEAPERAEKKPKQKPFQLSTAMRRILRRLDSIRSWTSPTEIGLSLNERHSAWASPKCLALTKQGYLQRSPWGHYRRTKKRVPA